MNAQDEALAQRHAQRERLAKYCVCGHTYAYHSMAIDYPDNTPCLQGDCACERFREATLTSEGKLKLLDVSTVAMKLSAPAETPHDKKRYEGEEISITAWKFPADGWRFQITAIGDMKKSSGEGYVVVTLNGASELWRELTQALRDRGVIA